MTTTDTRPVVFLDVDGVINVFSPRLPKPWCREGVDEMVITHVSTPNLPDRPGPWVIKYIPQVIEFINELSTHAQIVWLTSWGNEADRVLAPEIGIVGSFPSGFELSGVSMEYRGAQTLYSNKCAAFSLLMTGNVFPGEAVNADSNAMFAGRPAVWIDDENNRRTRDAFKDAMTPHPLILQTFDAVGISPDTIKQVREYVGF